MKTCSASSCSNNSMHHPELTWHMLPKDRWMRDQWIDLLGISELAINSTTRICSSHFKNRDFQHNKIYLRQDVIPSVRLANDTDSPSGFQDDSDLSDAGSFPDERKRRRTKRVMYPSATVKEEVRQVQVETSARPSRRAARMAAEKILHTVRKYGGVAGKKEAEMVPIHVDLVLECYDDVLTSAQLIAHSKAQQLFDETNRRLRQLRCENAKFIYCNADDNSIPDASPSPTAAPIYKTVTPTPYKTTTASPAYKTATVLTGGSRTPRSMLFTNKAKIDERATIPSSSLAYKVVLATPPPLTRAPEISHQVQPSTPSSTKEVINVEEGSTTGSHVVDDCEPSSLGPIPNIPGGMNAVTARSLMSIRVNILTSAQESDLLEQASQLEGIIENERILEEPIKWFVKLHLVAERPACRFCVPAHCNTGLEEDSSALDGYVWRCYGCTKSTPVTRLTFFARFTLPLPRLLKLIYYWVVQYDIDVVSEEVEGDVYMARTVYRALQDVCSRSLANKSNKIGGRGLVVEVGTAQLGNFFIVGAYDRRTKVTRLKVVSTSTVANLSSLVQKQLDAWLHSHTVVISSDPKLNGRSRTGLRFQQVKIDCPDMENIMDYLKTYLISMFGDLMLNQLKLETIQGFLDELQWRTRFGKTAWSCFFNMIKDIGQQSGKKVEMSMYEVDLSRMISAKTSLGRPVLQKPSLGHASKFAYSVTKPSAPIRSDASNHPTPSSSIPSSPASENSSEIQYAESVRKDRKRSAEENIGSAGKKVKADEDEGEVAVILDEYYYARKQASPLYVEEKGNYTFKCLVCTKMIDNNVKLMKHLMAHIENSRQKNLDLSDLTQCKYCFRDFETPYNMQCHMESVHLNTNDLACQICNQAFGDTSALIYHMKLTHVQSEMPYYCQVCGFRSSFHREVVEHFQQMHNGSDRVLCHYCLKVYQIKFSSVGAIGFVQGYYYHLYKHQMKSTAKKCTSCCLVFFNNLDWKNHKTNDHLSMISVEGVTPMECQSSKLVLVKDPHKKPDSKSKPPRVSPSASTSKKRSRLTPDNSQITLPDEVNKMKCVECNKFIEKEHFEKFVSCGKCRYSTNCCEAFVEHMICEHSTLEKKRFVRFKPTDGHMPCAMFCICGFSSTYGDTLASHMLDCQTKSCHVSMEKALATSVKREPDDDVVDNVSAFFPPLVVLEEDEEKVLKERFAMSNSGEPSPSSEQNPLVEEPTKEDKQPIEESAEKSHPCMLNALGLVRRRSSSTSQPASSREESDNSREAPPPLIAEDDGDSNESTKRGRKSSARIKKEKKEDTATPPPELENENVS